MDELAIELIKVATRNFASGAINYLTKKTLITLIKK